MLHDLINALEETVFMVFASGFLTYLIGLPLGILLTITQPKHLFPHRIIHTGLSIFINLASSVPYIILMIALIPLSQVIVDANQGLLAAIIPLTLAGIPLFTRVCQQSMTAVPFELIETAKAMGASSMQIIYKILIPEARSKLIHNLATTLVHLVGYSAIAGVFINSGLGSLAIQKGYHSFQVNYVLATIVLYVALVQIIQLASTYCCKTIRGTQ